jgi:hypothetical protein
MPNVEHTDFKALDPFFKVVREGLSGFVDGEQYFDSIARTPLRFRKCSRRNPREPRRQGNGCVVRSRARIVGACPNSTDQIFRHLASRGGERANSADRTTENRLYDIRTCRGGPDPLQCGRLSELTRTDARLGMKTGTRDCSVSGFAPSA